MLLNDKGREGKNPQAVSSMASEEPTGYLAPEPSVTLKTLDPAVLSRSLTTYYGQETDPEH